MKRLSLAIVVIFLLIVVIVPIRNNADMETLLNRLDDGKYNLKVEVIHINTTYQVAYDGQDVNPLLLLKSIKIEPVEPNDNLVLINRIKFSQGINVLTIHLYAEDYIEHKGQYYKVDHEDYTNFSIAIGIMTMIDKYNLE